MRKDFRHLIILTSIIILMMSPINVLAQWTHLGGESWRSPTGQTLTGKKPTSTTFAGDYQTSKFDPNEWKRMEQRSFNVKGSTGAVSTSPVSGTMTRTVPKAAAMGKIFSKVKTVGSLAARNLPIGRALLGYEVLKALLEQQGYEYNEEQEAFIDTKSDYIVTYKIAEYKPQFHWVDAKKFGILEETYKMGYEKGWRPLADKVCKEDKTSFSAKQWLELGYQASAYPTIPACMYEKNGDIRSSNSFAVQKNPYLTLTEQQFAEIVSREVESNLQKYLEPISEELEWIGSNILILDGSIVQSAHLTQTNKLDKPSKHLGVSTLQVQAKTPKPL